MKWLLGRLSVSIFEKQTFTTFIEILSRAKDFTVAVVKGDLSCTDHLQETGKCSGEKGGLLSHFLGFKFLVTFWPCVPGQVAHTYRASFSTCEMDLTHSANSTRLW